LQQWLLCYVSPSCKSTTGWMPQELIGTAAWDVCHPDDIPTLKRVTLTSQHNNTHLPCLSSSLSVFLSLSLSFFLIILSMPCISVCCCSSDTRAVRKIEALIWLFRCYTLGKLGHSQMAVSSTVACERTPPTQQYRQLDVLLAPGTPFFLLCL